MNERYKILSKLEDDYVIGILKKGKVIYKNDSKIIKRYFKDVNEIIIDNLSVISKNNVDRYKYEFIKSNLMYILNIIN